MNDDASWVSDDALGFKTRDSSGRWVARVLSANRVEENHVLLRNPLLTLVTVCLAQYKVLTIMFLNLRAISHVAIRVGACRLSEAWHSARE